MEGTKQNYRPSNRAWWSLALVLGWSAGVCWRVQEWAFNSRPFAEAREALLREQATPVPMGLRGHAAALIFLAASEAHNTFHRWWHRAFALGAPRSELLGYQQRAAELLELARPERHR